VKINIIVTLKDNVEDAEGQSVLKALHLLGYDEVSNVRTGKVYYIEMKGNDLSKGYEFCDKLLANPVINKCKVERDD